MHDLQGRLLISSTQLNFERQRIYRRDLLRYKVSLCPCSGMATGSLFGISPAICGMGYVRVIYQQE